MDIILTLLGLRYLARLLKAENTQAAGEKLDSDLNEVTDNAHSCMKLGCGCLVVFYIISMLAIALNWIGGMVMGR